MIYIVVLLLLVADCLHILYFHLFTVASTPDRTVNNTLNNSLKFVT